MAIFRKSRNARQESLSTDVEAYYSDAYSQIASSGAFGVMSKLQHRQMEKSTLLAGASGQRVLEVGAGSGQHISFVDPGSWSEYIQTDLRPPGLT
jgi:ubiquinone/menaquinone biosynthesis C-methylase UbiE